MRICTKQFYSYYFVFASKQFVRSKGTNIPILDGFTVETNWKIFKENQAADYNLIFHITDAPTHDDHDDFGKKVEQMLP